MHKFNFLFGFYFQFSIFCFHYSHLKESLETHAEYKPVSFQCSHNLFWFDVLINQIHWLSTVIFDEQTNTEAISCMVGRYRQSLSVHALSHTGPLQREWLIPSLISYCMSVVMCRNYWSEQRGLTTPAALKQKRNQWLFYPMDHTQKHLYRQLLFSH